ncbi:unnamed protein product [Phyllotreta striolata]|uniref:Uncharacterized protein n=1 Tax=Phyllotreta striolata TaxID=444603 RepID=A0A9N9TYM9_PHYSR|nr:unnamed protein product [Phyllotreta striolata]
MGSPVVSVMYSRFLSGTIRKIPYAINKSIEASRRKNVSIRGGSWTVERGRADERGAESEWREMFCSRPVVPDISESDSAVRVTFSNLPNLSPFAVSRPALFEVAVRHGEATRENHQCEELKKRRRTHGHVTVTCTSLFKDDVQSLQLKNRPVVRNPVPAEFSTVIGEKRPGPRRRDFNCLKAAINWRSRCASCTS